MAESASSDDREVVDAHIGIEHNLRYALESDDPKEKNYFIRTALQFVELRTE